MFRAFTVPALRAAVAAAALLALPGCVAYGPGYAYGGYPVAYAPAPAYGYYAPAPAVVVGGGWGGGWGGWGHGYGAGGYGGWGHGYGGGYGGRGYWH